MAGSIRGLLAGADARAREDLAGYCLAYLGSFLLRRHRIRSSGFADGFSEVVAGVSDLETAVLLRMEAGEEGRQRPLTLMRHLVRKPMKDGTPEAMERALLALDDRTLFYSLRSTLRLVGDQGLQRAWKELHPEQWGFARSFRRLCRRHGEPALVWDLRGRRVVGPASRPEDPCIGVEGLKRIVACARPPFLPAGVARVLLPELTPAGGHGGHCYLMDLARAVCELRLEHLISRVVMGTSSGSPVPGGLSRSLLLEKARRSLEDLVRSFRAGRDGRDQEARNQAAVILVLRRYDPGHPDWAGLSLRGITERCLRAHGCPDDPDLHRERVRSLAARLGRRWEGDPRGG